MQAEFLLSREQNRTLGVSRCTNQNYRLHFHTHIEICLVTEGEEEVWINDRRQVLKAGDFSVAWSYDAHGYRTERASKSLSLVIPPELFREFQPLLAGYRTRENFFTDAVLFEKLRASVESILQTDSELLRKGYIYVILGILLENVAIEDTQEQTDPTLVSRVLLYLNQSYRENITLQSVAAEFGYHPSYLSRLFKNTLRIGFNHYLTVLRLRETLLLMRAGEKNVTEAALESGFQSLRSFYRCFQVEFGCTPREYLLYNPS